MKLYDCTSIQLNIKNHKNEEDNALNQVWNTTKDIFLSKTKVVSAGKIHGCGNKNVVWEVVFPMYTLLNNLDFLLTKQYQFLVFQFNEVGNYKVIQAKLHIIYFIKITF